MNLYILNWNHIIFGNVLAGRATYLGCYLMCALRTFMRALFLGFNVLAGRATYLGCTLVRVLILCCVCTYLVRVPLAALAKGMYVIVRGQQNIYSAPFSL